MKWYVARYENGSFVSVGDVGGSRSDANEWAETARENNAVSFENVKFKVVHELERKALLSAK